LCFGLNAGFSLDGEDGSTWNLWCQYTHGRHLTSKAGADEQVAKRRLATFTKDTLAQRWEAFVMLFPFLQVTHSQRISTSASVRNEVAVARDYLK
jgi:hypothetical protein